MTSRFTSFLPPQPDWTPTPSKGPWREVSSGRWEHDGHGAIVQAVRVVDDNEAYLGWQVWTDKPQDAYRKLSSAKVAASHLGKFYSKPELKQLVLDIEVVRRFADARLHALIIDHGFNASVPFNEVGCATFTAHVQQAVEELDPGRWIAEVLMPTDAVMWAQGAVRLNVMARTQTPDLKS